MLRPVLVLLTTTETLQLHVLHVRAMLQAVAELRPVLVLLTTTEMLQLYVLFAIPILLTAVAIHKVLATLATMDMHLVPTAQLAQLVGLNQL